MNYWEKAECEIYSINNEVKDAQTILKNRGSIFCKDVDIPLHVRWLLFTEIENLGKHDEWLPDCSIIRTELDDYIADRDRHVTIDLVDHFEDEICYESYGCTKEEYIESVEKHKVLIEAILQAQLRSFTIDW